MIALFIATFTLSAQGPDYHDVTGIVQKLYQHFDKGEVPEVLALFDSNIEWNEAEGFSYADGNPYLGPDAVLNGVFGRLNAEWDNFTLTNRTYHDVDQDKVLVTGYYSATNKATRKPLKAQFAHLWWVRNGKIQKFQQYTDTHQWASTMN